MQKTDQNSQEKGRELDPDQQIQDLQDKDELCVGPERPRKAKPNLQDNDEDLKDEEMQWSDPENQKRARQGRGPANHEKLCKTN